MSLTPMQLVAEARAQIRETDVTSATKLLESGVLCLDVREPAEYEAGRLPGAINLPRGVVEFRIGEHPAFADKSRPAVVYCKTGGRSALAVLNLQRIGYTDLVSMSGGIEAWSSQGLPVLKDTNRYGNE
ncbi:MAG: rhodanese-like domain-containing protein [Nitrosomonadales bacterium]|nr:rhodanese-like domain-containing protein [Nitrosomonadales bacterium]